MLWSLTGFLHPSGMIVCTGWQTSSFAKQEKPTQNPKARWEGFWEALCGLLEMSRRSYGAAQGVMCFIGNQLSQQAKSCFEWLVVFRSMRLQRKGLSEGLERSGCSVFGMSETA